MQHLELTLHDFTLAEVAKDYHLIVVDPERKSVFTAMSGLNEARHSIIRCSTKEYYHFTGSTVFSAQQQFLKSQNRIKDIESRIPTTKTSDPERFLDYVQHLFDSINNYLTLTIPVLQKNASNFIKGDKKRKKLWPICL